MRFAFRAVLAAAGMALSAVTADAVPIRVDYDLIRNGHIEDFESWPEGPINPPELNDVSRVNFRDFSYWSEDPIITDVFCEGVIGKAEKCLSSNDLLSKESERIF